MPFVSVLLDDDKSQRLTRLSEKLDRPPSDLATDAVIDYLAREEWQLAEIEAGLAEADRGEFCSVDDLARVVAKYVTPGLRS